MIFVHKCLFFKLTIFRLGEKQQDVDHAILTALLKGQNLSPADQVEFELFFIDYYFKQYKKKFVS